MERQFFSGNTIEQAVMAAARHYGLDPSRVAYKSRDKKHGFLNIRRRVVIEVDPDAPEKPETPAGELPEGTRDASAVAADADQHELGSYGRESESARESPGRDTPAPDTPGGEDRAAERRARPAEDPPAEHVEGDEGDDEIWGHRQALQTEFAEENAGEDKEVAAFEKALDEVVELVEMELEATVTRQEDVIEIHIEGEDGEFLVERDGLLLRAIEHLLPRLVRGLVGYGLPCRVDCNGFQQARESELREMAGGMAELARRQGKPQKLEPMSPADRRLVHLALADDPTVRTESEGSGYMKRIKVLPV